MTRIITILTLILLAACNRKAPALEKTITPVRVAPVDTFQPKAGGRYSASIVPGRQTTLAFPVSGVVTSIARIGGRGLEAGDMVPAGSVLARLRDEDYRHATAQALGRLDSARETLRSATAQFAQSQASHTKAEADFTRAKTLMASQSLTRPDYDAAKAQFDVSNAQVDAARAQIDSAAAQIRTVEASTASARLAQRDTTLLSPFAASVVHRNVEVGSMAGPSQAAYTLADISNVKAVFGVPDTVVVQLAPGRKIPLSVEALPDRDWQGTITAIASVADAETRLFQVELTIPNPRLALKPGMIASLTLRDAGAAPSVPVVPLGAVIRDRDHPSDFAVMVVENKVAKSRKVSLGPTFGDVLAITAGLKPGELVIRAGANLVNNGETVEVIP